MIDSLLPTKNHRELLLKLSGEFKYTPVAFIFDVEKGTAIWLDSTRAKNPHRKHLSKKVGVQPIAMFFDTAQKPDPQEGFQEIFHVNLVLKYENPEDEAFYNTLT